MVSLLNQLSCWSIQVPFEETLMWSILNVTNSSVTELETPAFPYLYFVGNEGMIHNNYQ